MGFEIHHGGNPLNNVANLHIAMAIRNTTWFEVLVQSSAMNTASSGRACCTLRRNPGSGTRSTWSWSHGSGSIAVLELPRTPIGAAARWALLGSGPLIVVGRALAPVRDP